MAKAENVFEGFEDRIEEAIQRRRLMNALGDFLQCF